MSSGLNGQNFAFTGYLPIDKSERNRRIKEGQKGTERRSQAQLEGSTKAPIDYKKMIKFA